MRYIVKNTTRINIFDLVAPHTCRGCGALGSVLCECCKNNLVLSRKPTKTKTPIICIGRRDDVLAKLIHDYKYSSTRAIGPILAELLDKKLPNINGQVIIVPLPTIPRHIRERGLDHTLKIAKKLAKIRGKNYKVKQLLVRKNNTVQVGTDRKTRIIQAKKAYDISPNAKIDKSATYILFDDVWTTGASMTAAKKKLQQAGASKIIISVLAVS
jgi:ComF family protein